MSLNIDAFNNFSGTPSPSPGTPAVSAGTPSLSWPTQQTLVFYQKAVSSLQKELFETKRNLKQIARGVNVQHRPIDRATEDKIQRKFAHLRQPTLEACIKVWKKKGALAFHKREPTRLLVQQYRGRYQPLTFYKQIELLSDPRRYPNGVTPLLHAKQRGYYLVNPLFFARDKR